MCFSIDWAAKRPARRVAWKVVRILPSGQVGSVMYDRKRWSCNKTHRIRYGAQTTEYGHYANEGIYVYHTLSKAQSNAAYYLSDRVVMKVEVDPADWLYTNSFNTVSTYRAVYVPEEQPYMTWY